MDVKDSFNKTEKIITLDNTNTSEEVNKVFKILSEMRNRGKTINVTFSLEEYKMFQEIINTFIGALQNATK